MILPARRKDKQDICIIVSEMTPADPVGQGQEVS